MLRRCQVYIMYTTSWLRSSVVRACNWKFARPWVRSPAAVHWISSSDPTNHLEMVTMVSVETNVVSRDSMLDKLSEKADLN